jgi:glycosyltransferase involved in cell wall biosynthesis
MIARNLNILDPSFDGSFSGHYCSYDLAIAQAAIDSDWSATIFGARDAEKIESSIPIKMHFSSDIWGKMPAGKVESFLTIQKSRFDEFLNLSKNFTSSGSGQIVFIPNIGPFDLEVLMKNAELFSDQKLLLLFRYHDEIFNTLIAEYGQDKISSYLNSDHVYFATDSEFLGRDYAKKFSLDRFVVLPPPNLVGPFPIGEHPALDKIKLGTLGNPRREKGFTLIAATITNIIEDIDVVFNLQVNNPADDCISSLDSLSRLQNKRLTMNNENLSNSEYLKRLMEMDLVLAPYDPKIYRSRTSSVLVESQLAAKPIIVSNNTWLASVVSEYGGGLIMNEWTQSDLQKQIQFALKNIDALRKQSMIAQRLQNEVSNPINIWNIIKSTVTEPIRQSALIIYPWSAEQLMSSGAGRVVLNVEKKLISSGFNVEILCVGKVESFNTPLGSTVTTFQVDFEKRTGNIHVDFHNARISERYLSSIFAKLERANRIYFEATHMVLPFQKSFPEFDFSESFITSHDVLRCTENIVLDQQILYLQRSSLRAGKAFVDSQRDIEFWENEHVSIEYRDPSSLMEKVDLPRELSQKISRSLTNNHSGNHKFVFFVASDYEPNRVALGNIESVAKILYKRDPSIKFVIAGSVAKKKIVENLIYLGKVTDFSLASLMYECDAFFCPLEEGTGISIKAIEAARYEANLISTNVGLRGLDLGALKSRFDLIVNPRDYIRVADLVQNVLSLPVGNGDPKRIFEERIESCTFPLDNFKLFTAMLDIDDFDVCTDLLLHYCKNSLTLTEVTLLNFIFWEKGFVNESYRFATEDYLHNFSSDILHNLSELNDGIKTPIDGRWIVRTIEKVFEGLPIELVDKKQDFLDQHLLNFDSKKLHLKNVDLAIASSGMLTVSNLLELALGKSALARNTNVRRITNNTYLQKMLRIQLRPRFLVRLMIRFAKLIKQNT